MQFVSSVCFLLQKIPAILFGSTESLNYSSDMGLIPDRGFGFKKRNDSFGSRCIM